VQFGGRYASVLGVRGATAVAEALCASWASASSARAADYWSHANSEKHAGGVAGGGGHDMAVLVQRLVDADASGVMFTPGAAR